MKPPTTHLAPVLAIMISVTACGGTPSEPQTSGGASSPSAVASPTTVTSEHSSKPSVDGRFPVDSSGRQLSLICWGTGSPVIVFDAGSGDAGIGRWSSIPALIDPLAGRTQVCAYDRAGLGTSDPAPERKRVLDDVVEDLHNLLLAAEVRPPYVMVGASGGGFDVYHHAGRYPKEVAGLVLLDVPAGQAKMSAEDVKELAWDNPTNVEHVDYVAVEQQMALHRLPIPRIPVTVVTAKQGQSATKPDEQRVWLKGSSHPVQKLLDGPHDIAQSDPEAVLAEVEKVFLLAKGS